MSKPFKVAVILSAVIILFDLVLYAFGGLLNLGTICMLGVGFIILTLFFWFIFTMGRFLLKGGDKVLKFLEEIDKLLGTTKKKKKTTSTYKKFGDLVLYEEDENHRSYVWKKYLIILGTPEYSLMNNLNIPYPGAFIINGQDKVNDFVIFKRTMGIELSPETVKKMVINSVENGNCDLLMAWKGSAEVACANNEYFFLHSYGIKYAGLVFSNAGVIHLFEHNCKGVNSKDKLFTFTRRNVNKNEIALAVILPGFIIRSLSEKVAYNMLKIKRDLLEIIFPDEKLTYIYDIPFRVRTKKKLIKLANDVHRLHAEVGVVVDTSNKMIMAAKADLARFFIPDSTEEDLKTDVILIYPEGEDQPIIAPVKWRMWTRDELIKEASEIIGAL